MFSFKCAMKSDRSVIIESASYKSNSLHKVIRTVRSKSILACAVFLNLIKQIKYINKSSSSAN
jgi:hypothetical protein